MKIFKLISFIFLATALLSSCTNKANQSGTATTPQQQTDNAASTQQEEVYSQLSPSQFAESLKTNTGLLLDVRTPEEFNAGAIEEAKNFDFYQDNFKTQLESLDKNQTVYVYCAAGGRSKEASTLMEQMGFKKIVELKGGYNAWKQEFNK